MISRALTDERLRPSLGGALYRLTASSMMHSVPLRNFHRKIRITRRFFLPWWRPGHPSEPAARSKVDLRKKSVATKVCYVLAFMGIGIIAAWIKQSLCKLQHALETQHHVSGSERCK